jgi:hypothetical protein
LHCVFLLRSLLLRCHLLLLRCRLLLSSLLTRRRLLTRRLWRGGRAACTGGG